MTTAQIVLEYLKVVLSAPVMTAAAAIGLALLFRNAIKSLFTRIAVVKVAGLGELQTSQSSRAESTSLEGKEDPEPLPPQGTSAAPVLTVATKGDAEERVRAERERAYLWEYRYLNLHLVRGTQMVLDWFAARSGPTTYAVYDSWWSSLVVDPNERFARIAVLKSHFLLLDDNGLLSVSEKGREYLTWRGPLPPLPSGS